MGYENHPGHEASCSLKQKVTPALYSTSSKGYGCNWTGGHCVPGDECTERRKQDAEEEEQQAQLAKIPLFNIGSLSLDQFDALPDGVRTQIMFRAERLPDRFAQGNKQPRN